MEGLVISDAVKDLIINIINIIVLFVIVRGLAYKPVKRFLDARKERVSKELSDAAQARQTAEEEALKYKELTEKSKMQQAEIINGAERTAKQNAAEIIETAKQNAAEITEKARENSQKEHDAQIAAMKGDIADIAFDISRQVLSREVTDEDNMRIADSFFAKYQG